MAAAALEGADLADPPALEDLGAEILADEPDAGGVAYFGDDFPTMKLKKIGRKAADDFLKEHGQAIGRDSTLDIDALLAHV